MMRSHKLGISIEPSLDLAQRRIAPDERRIPGGGSGPFDPLQNPGRDAKCVGQLFGVKQADR
jgi:hypothetical protein